VRRLDLRPQHACTHRPRTETHTSAPCLALLESERTEQRPNAREERLGTEK
jgi:hypothetical protein